MTAPLASAPSGAPTWSPPDDVGPPASPRSQIATAALVCGALLLVAGLASALGWGLAYALALVAGIAIGLAAPPIGLLRRMSGLVLAIIVAGVAMLAVVLSWSAAGVELPPGIIPALALVALGLDWRRADRLRPLVTLSGAPVLLVALSQEPWAVGAAVVWLAAAFGTYTMLEGDRRAALPRVQPDARSEAQEARPDDLLTTLLIAVAVALLAALVLGVPSCQQRLRGPKPPIDSLPSGSLPSGSGSGSGSGSSSSSGADPGSSSGSGAPGSHQYVPDPDGRFLIPRDGSGGGSTTGTARIPSPEDVPDGLEPGTPTTITGSDGTEVTYELDEGGDVAVTVRDPDGRVTDWRFHERADGLVEIDRRNPDGSLRDRWWYDPEGRLAQGGSGAGSDATPPPEPEPKEPRDRPDLATIGRVLGALVLLAGLAALAWWWWRRRHPDIPPVPVPSAPPWALALAARLDDEGAARGRPRSPEQTVVRYGRDLADGPLPDGRLVVVAEVVSDALFSASDPGPSVATWAQATFDEIVAAHPVPSRREARRSGEPTPV